MLYLERALDEVERLLDSPPAGITYTTEVDFSPTTIQQIREQCRDMRRQITEMVAVFELPPHHQNGRRVIVAEMSIIWTYLEDMRPSKLRRYGAVDPALSETLPPRLERLIASVRAVQTLASRGE